MIVYIKGMEMPTSCRKCKVSQPDGCGWICPIIESKPIVDGRVNSRHPHCPLVPVSPHGRCIDVDALIKELTLNDEDDNSGASLLMAIFIEVLKAAPTIIPAEEPSGDSGMLEG